MFWLERRLLFFRLDRYDIPFPYDILTQGSSMQYMRSDKRPVDQQKRWGVRRVHTEGVLAFKFPISILTQTQVSKNLKKSEKFCYSLILSAGSWIWENLKIGKNFARKYFSFVKKCNWKSMEPFSSVGFVHPWYLYYRNFFWPKIGHRNERNYKMGALVTKS